MEDVTKLYIPQPGERVRVTRVGDDNDSPMSWCVPGGDNSECGKLTPLQVGDVVTVRGADRSGAFNGVWIYAKGGHGCTLCHVEPAGAQPAAMPAPPPEPFKAEPERRFCACGCEMMGVSAQHTQCGECSLALLLQSDSAGDGFGPHPEEKPHVWDSETATPGWEGR